MKQGFERLKRQAMFAAAALALLGLPPWADPVQGEDWPQWRGPNRDGISRETGLLNQWPAEGPPVVWRVPGGEGFSSVSVAGGRAFTMAASGEEEFALCLDAVTGKQLWKRRLGEKFTEGHGNGPRSTPTVEGDRVFILGSRGMLTALNAGTGETVWASDLREVLGSGLPPWGFAA
ncbi:MAG: PQQ-binding-like beta-propeller repeat protein, partial [Gemmatimonadetes bacterium]|nr:PQQ-binding-like beta-propeller repeat protein [Gemmatimonadota bacterium]